MNFIRIETVIAWFEVSLVSTLVVTCLSYILLHYETNQIHAMAQVESNQKTRSRCTCPTKFETIAVVHECVS